MTGRFVTSDGVAIDYCRRGRSNPGPVAVLHHGFATSAYAIPNAQCLMLPSDHLTVIRQAGFAAAAIDFLHH